MVDPKQPLKRNTKNAMLGGVCAGIGDYVGWDHTLVRVIWAVLTVLTVFWAGVIIYLLLWLIMPPDTVKPGESTQRAEPGEPTGEARREA